MTQHKDVVVSYDNFDYLQKARHQVIDTPSILLLAQLTIPALFVGLPYE